MHRFSYLRALDVALHGAGLPYGYAITVWSTGAMVMSERGKPSVAHVFLFAAGAAVAYGVLRFLTKDAEGNPSSQLTRSPHLVRAGAFHVSAMGLAIGAAALIGRIDSGVAWPLASLAATLLYLGVSTGEKALQEREHGSSVAG